MWNRLWVLMPTLGFVVCAFGSDPNRDASGSDWRKWNELTRLTYVRAVVETSNKLLAEKAIGQINAPTRTPETVARAVNDAQASNPYVPRSQITVGDLTEALDRFYATPENRPIRILSAMTILAAKFNGASDICISEQVLLYRMVEAADRFGDQEFGDQGKRVALACR